MNGLCLRGNGKEKTGLKQMKSIDIGDVTLMNKFHTDRYVIHYF